MKALILTLGTRGDVQPFVSLARAFDEAGHEAVLAAPGLFEEFVRGNDVRFAPLDDGPMRVMDTQMGRGAMGGGLRARLNLARQLPRLFDQLLEDVWEVASEGDGVGADVVVHNGQVLAGPHVAEKLGVPAAMALPIPMYVPTGDFPWPGTAMPRFLPSRLNRATYLGMRSTGVMFGRTVDRWRSRTLGLPGRRGRHDPLRRPDGESAFVLHAFSPLVVPPPADWPETVETTGYWFLPAKAGWKPPDDLVEFLEAGEPPVFFGFGSMAGRDPAGTGRAVVEAVSRAGVRAVISTGWGGLEVPEPRRDVLVVKQVPYDWLLPRVAAVVHHGGAGTTGAAVAAGRPQIVCPFVADQPFWAGRMHELGVASSPLPQRKLTVERLTRSIQFVTSDGEMRRRAEDLGRKVREENGVERAVGAIIEEVERSNSIARRRGSVRQ